MSRKSRTTLTFTVTLPLPQKAAAKGAEKFLYEAIKARQETLRHITAPDPFAFLATNEVLIRQTGRETVYF